MSQNIHKCYKLLDWEKRYGKKFKCPCEALMAFQTAAPFSKLGLAMK